MFYQILQTVDTLYCYYCRAFVVGDGMVLLNLCIGLPMHLLWFCESVIPVGRRLEGNFLNLQSHSILQLSHYLYSMTFRAQHENCRYWTEDEHQRFLDALQSVGPKDVKAIASFVGSRSATQVRTHAQKYFLKLVSALDCPLSVSK